MMSSIRSSACGFSIFDMIPARSPMSPRASITSEGFCTKDRATQSTPSSSPKARSARSFSVSGERSSRVPGRFTPLRFEIAPPVTTSAVMVVRSEADDPHPHPPVVDEQFLARHDRGEDLRDDAAGSPACRPPRLPARSARVSPAFEVEAAALTRTDADLRSLEILQDADRPADLLLQGADRGVDPGVILLECRG